LILWLAALQQSTDVVPRTTNQLRHQNADAVRRDHVGLHIPQRLDPIMIDHIFVAKRTGVVDVTSFPGRSHHTRYTGTDLVVTMAMYWRNQIEDSAQKIWCRAKLAIAGS